MAGRPKGAKSSKPVMGEEHRAKIRNSGILNRLIRHAEGQEPDMTASEASTGMGLLGFAFPKLQSVDPDTGKAGISITISSEVSKL